MNELDAMKLCDDALEQLDDITKSRVLRWILDKHGHVAAMCAVSSHEDVGSSTLDVDRIESEFGPRANRWIKTNGITDNHLENVFHISPNGVEVIVSGLRGTKKEQTQAAYLLQGVSGFLATDQPTFDDQAARDLCDRLGCYDSTNHAKILADFGNRLTGNKRTGWTLTAPGLNAAAEIIRSLA